VPCVTLLYRRNQGNGTWIVRAAAGDGRSYWTKAFAEADDYAEAGETVVTFYDAQDRAKELARGSDSATDTKSARRMASRA
jgi:hypothetical protein